MNGSNLTREEFIGQVALCIYNDEPNTDIRKTIDLLLSDTERNWFVMSGGNKFFTYITNGEENYFRQGDFDGDILEKDMEQEEYPKNYYNK